MAPDQGIFGLVVHQVSPPPGESGGVPLANPLASAGAPDMPTRPRSSGAPAGGSADGHGLLWAHPRGHNGLLDQAIGHLREQHPAIPLVVAVEQVGGERVAAPVTRAPLVVDLGPHTKKSTMIS